MDALTRLAAFAVDTRLADVAAAPRARLPQVLADCIACAGAGMQTMPLQRLIAMHLKGSDSAGAAVIGGRRRAAPLDAAFLNATAGVWDDYDEGSLEANGHPGIQLVPAALAWAEAHHASGAALLSAMIVGYEVAARIGRAARIKVIVHPHGTFGTVGAAVAIGRLEGLDATTMRVAINIAAALANASNRNTLRDAATVRNAFAGHANYAGQLAVRLAQCGFTGERDAVSNTFGTILGEGFDLDSVDRDLGSDWLSGRGYFKVHANGRFIHSAVDALEDALAQINVATLPADDVRHVTVRTFHYAARLDNAAVQSAFGARFSVPFAMATRIIHPTAGLDAFSERAVVDPAIIRLTQRVTVIEEPAWTLAYPDKQISEVRLELSSGTIVGRCEVMKGEPTRPHSPNDIEAKFKSLAVPIWGNKGAETLLARCLDISECADVAAFSRDVQLSGPAELTQ